jgi:hypothetical protein
LPGAASRRRRILPWPVGRWRFGAVDPRKWPSATVRAVG